MANVRVLKRAVSSVLLLAALNAGGCTSKEDSQSDDEKDASPSNPEDASAKDGATGSPDGGDMLDGSAGDGALGSSDDAALDAAGDAGGDAGGGGGITNSEVSGSVTRVGPLQFAVAAKSYPVLASGRLQYEVKVSNTSTQAVDAVRVLMRVATGLRFNYIQDAVPNEQSGCGNSTCSEGEEAQWLLGTIAAGASRIILVDSEALATLAVGPVTANFRFSATGVDTTVLDKTVPAVAAVSTKVALATSKDKWQVGEKVTYQVHVGHVGATPLSDTKLHLYLPNGVTVASIPEGGTIDDKGHVVWDVGAMPVGYALQRSLEVTLGSGLKTGDILPARAELTYGPAATVDGRAEQQLTVIGAPLTLHAELVTESCPAVPGAPVRSFITVSNTGERAVDNVQVIMRVPAGLAFNYISNASPNENSGCGNSTCNDDEEAVWSFPKLEAHASTRIEVSSIVSSTTVGNGNLLVPEALLLGTGAPEVRVMDVFPVRAAPAAQLALATATDPVVPGQSFTLDLNVGQVGVSSLQGAKLRAVLPAGLTLVSASDNGTVNGSSVEWDLGNVAIGATLGRTLQVTARADLTPGAILTAAATLTYQGGLDNDVVAERSITVVTEALPLTLTIVPSPTSVVPGARVLYTATITNTSGRALDQVSLGMRVATGMQFNYINDAEPNESSGCGNSTCGQDGNGNNEEALWNLGTFAAGATQVVTVNPLIASTLVAGSLLPTTFKLYNATLPASLYVSKTVVTRQ